MFGRKKKKADADIDEQAAKRVRDEALDDDAAVEPKRAADIDDDVEPADAVESDVADVEDKDSADDPLAAAETLSDEAVQDATESATPTRTARAADAPAADADDESSADHVGDADEELDADDADDDDEGDESEDDADADAEDDEDEPSDEWEELQNSQDWREDGPFDHDEVDLEGDEVQRIDFGSLILTPTEDTQLQLQVEQETGNVQAALVMMGQSGLEIALFAAPKSGGLAKTVRDEMMASVEQTGGSCEFAEGPFGVEVRRIVPVRMPDGQEGLHVSKTWLAEGPRWLLRGVLMGEACVSEDAAAQEDFVEFFKNLIVRRGDVPLPPGELIPMTLPDDLKPPQAPPA